jgi:hypothetical protein
VSADGELQEVVLLPDAVVLKAHMTVQCATLIAEPDAEHPDGQSCGNVLEGEAEITFEPGMAAEMGIECPACSKRVSAELGRPAKAVIPIAILIGSQVEETLPTEDEDLDADAADEDGTQEAPGDEQRDVVELTPADQGAEEEA